MDFGKNFPEGLSGENPREPADAPPHTAAREGWHVSRYIVAARIPGDGQGRFAVANLSRGSCGAYPPLELAALAMLNELPPDHPAVERLARRGLIVNFGERAALEAKARMACAGGRTVTLTICPTMACNFDCPYCFEKHGGPFMSQEVQDDVEALAGRMMDAAGAGVLRVVWFGGEPLLAARVIESLSGRLIGLAEGRGAKYHAEAVTNGYLLTPAAVELLGRARVSEVQVTLDGVGTAHDATRHLAGGGTTFDRIVENLSRPGLPFRVSVRHNVHQGNLGEAEKVRALTEELAAQTGNSIAFCPALVLNSETAERRGQQVGLLDGPAFSEVMLSNVLPGTGPRAIPCGACHLFDLGVDPEGRLHKCRQTVDKPGLSFGAARDWDPRDPLTTASRPDNLTGFINCAYPPDDDECAACLWLPVCAGGCPYERLMHGRRQCVPFREDPEGYVLALWRDSQAEQAT